MNFTCPVCAYNHMEAPPQNYEICPCCGTEFGNDDELMSHSQLREQWMAAGMPWFFQQQPENWDPLLQLALGGLLDFVPYQTKLSNESNTLRKPVKNYTDNLLVLAECA